MKHIAINAFLPYYIFDLFYCSGSAVMSLASFDGC